jgi:hypothetical protein
MKPIVLGVDKSLHTISKICGLKNEVMRGDEHILKERRDQELNEEVGKGFGEVV